MGTMPASLVSGGLFLRLADGSLSAGFLHDLPPACICALGVSLCVQMSSSYKEGEMAADSREIPGREAWWATVYQVTELDTTELRNTHYT